MNHLEFSNYHNRLCKFILEDGEEVGGVIVADRANSTLYHLIRSFNLRAYKNAEQIGDLVACRELSETIDIARIFEAEIIL
jgi:hypothetical protein